jgi:hypothetical protein
MVEVLQQIKTDSNLKKIPANYPSNPKDIAKASKTTATAI